MNRQCDATKCRWAASDFAIWIHAAQVIASGSFQSAQGRVPSAAMMTVSIWRFQAARGRASRRFNADLAHLQAEDVDWPARIICSIRMKSRWRGQQPPQIRFGKEVEAILATLPKSGPLFPYLQNVEPGHRATEFRQRCIGPGIRGVTLRSYRYAWAERAKVVGDPERFAQLALGHNSKAVHRAYARKAQVTLPPLEDHEKDVAAAAIIPLPLPTTG